MANKCVCNQCGAEFDVIPHRRIEGDLEIVFLQCPHCNEEYLASITDSVLRDAIVDYNKTIHEAKTAADVETSEALAMKAREMIANNLLRCKELKAKYRQ